MRRAAAIAFVLLLLAPAAASAQAAPPPPVRPKPGAGEAREDDSSRIARIVVEGERRAEEAAVVAAMASRVGELFDPKDVRKDLKQIFALGLFADVQIDAEETSKGVVLTVKVEERPAIREVKLRGNDEISSEDLEKEIDVQPFQVFDLQAVKRNVAKLTQQYVEKGFYLAEVSYEIREVGPGEVDVVFVVDEHAKVVVKEIRFLGNEKIPAGDLKAAMLTQEGDFFSFLTGSGTYREDVFARDLQLAQGVYYDNGYINVKFGKPTTALSADKQFLYITIPVEEGEQFSIGKVDFAGDILTTKEDLFAKMSTESGQIFSRSRLQRDIQALTDVYHDEAYAYVNITPLTAVHARDRIVDLTFDIQKGKKVRWERIEIVGNDKTRDKVIRRELRVYEGELYNGTRLRQSRARVNALGFFETVEFSTRKGSTDTLIIGVVEVKEKPTGTFQVGAGFSSVESFIATAQVSQNNLIGWGPSASLSAQLSSLRQLVQLQFVEPYLFDSEWTFAFDFFKTQADYGGFVRDAIGGDVTFGHPLPVGFTEDLRLFLTYTLEDVEVTAGGSTTGTVPLAGAFADGVTSSARLTLNWDTRNNRLFPSQGFTQSVSVERADPLLLSDFVFTRYTGVSRWYFQPVWKLVFKVNATVGYIDAGGEMLPISEYYYLGGINSVRGYTLRSIGPTKEVGFGNDPQSQLFSYVTGGDKQLVLNNELEFPIIDKVGIRGVVFYDVGNVWAPDRAFFDDPQHDLPLGVFHSTGFGFRWFSPIGPLRFEWGIPITPRPQDESYLFEFTIGNSF